MLYMLMQIRVLFMCEEYVIPILHPTVRVS